ncbi:hypothetical protein LBBP_01053 [Leptospira borgpetersenii serovar Ballum]|uniref:Uncharacterized protein n=1 Tax=Leptospira borgpetersenii serovar Ballum TaxID=280505 RepID=A0A0S2INX1_LEPBO|nr:hypothetical protein LBBP_01053 [Leptospira borgpetersenii serovar Ballum]
MQVKNLILVGTLKKMCFRFYDSKILLRQNGAPSGLEKP